MPRCRVRNLLAAALISLAACAREAPPPPAPALTLPPSPSPSPADPREAKRSEPGVEMVPIAGGYNVFTKRVGTGPVKMLLLHGGPGATHEYFENFANHLPPAGVEVIFYDQLGSYYSDQPDDLSLWRTPRFVEELEQVRARLGLDKFYLFGNSWGGILLIEYALKHPEHLKAVVISNMAGDLDAYEKHIAVLRAQIPAEQQAILERHEAAKTFESPEYQAVVFEQLYKKHLCRVDPWPEPVMRTFEHLAQPVYITMNGHNEFFIDGNLKGWNRLADLKNIKQPTLLVVGRHDTMAVADVEEMGRRIPNSRVVVAENGSHLSWWDDEEFYFAELLKFVREVEAGTFQSGARQPGSATR